MDRRQARVADNVFVEGMQSHSSRKECKCYRAAASATGLHAGILEVHRPMVQQKDPQLLARQKAAPAPLDWPESRCTFDTAVAAGQQRLYGARGAVPA